MAKDKFREEPQHSWLYNFLNWPRLAIKRTYAWMMRWADSPRAEKALFAFSFTESSFFPIPPDPMLITMVIANSKKWLRLALITTIASVIGALFGYFIGLALFESIGRPIVEAYGLHEEFAQVGERFDATVFWTVLAAGFTPIPFKVFTIAGGLFHVNLGAFVAASILSRGTRFTLVAFISKKLGARYKDRIERYIDLISITVLAVVVLGFLAIRYVI